MCALEPLATARAARRATARVSTAADRASRAKPAAPPHYAGCRAGRPHPSAWRRTAGAQELGSGGASCACATSCRRRGRREARAASPSVVQMVDVAAGSARIDANGVSSPTKNPVRRNTAIAASSSSAGTPGSEQCVDRGRDVHRGWCHAPEERLHPPTVALDFEAALFQRHCAKMPSPPE